MQEVAAVADDLALGHLAAGDLVHLRLELGGHLGVAIRGTYFLNASYIAIPVSEGIGGLL